MPSLKTVPSYPSPILHRMGKKLSSADDDDNAAAADYDDDDDDDDNMNDDIFNTVCKHMR